MNHIAMPRAGHAQDARHAWMVVVGMWIYALIGAAWLAGGWGGIEVSRFIATWQSTLSDVAVLALLIPLIRQSTPGFRRTGWQFVFWAAVSDLFAGLWLTFSSSRIGYVDGAWNELPFSAYYVLASAAFAMFYRDRGGSFRTPQVWLDILTLALGFGASLWLFFLDPATRWGVAGESSVVGLLDSTVGNGMLLIFASLLVMQICEWKPERPLLLLIIATIVAFTAELRWPGSTLKRKHLLDVWSNLGGYGLYYSILGTAVVIERFHRTPGEIKLLEGNRYSFLPILLVLCVTGMLYGGAFDLRSGEELVMLAFAALGVILIVVRQQGVRLHILRMQNALARRDAQAYLTELIRRSTDLVMVVSPQGLLAFVSPAADTLLGVEARELEGKPMGGLLGAENETQLSAFLWDISQRRASRVEMEVVTVTSEGQRRNLIVVGSDQRGNEAIAGIALTINDVTEKRRLEREVLEITMHERERLARCIRDELGLELNGIKRHVERLKFNPQDFGRAVSLAIGQVNRAIELARKLAVDLSPLHVVRGSLELAIGRLATDVGQRFAVQVGFRFGNLRVAIPVRQADHLYRIAQQVLEYAAEYGNCTRIQVELSANPERVVLSIRGDGCSEASRESEAELGLRMAEYRARIIGGSMRRERTDEGACVEVLVPLQATHALAAEPTP